MNWEQACRLLRFGRDPLKERGANSEGRGVSPSREESQGDVLGVARAASLCVASGKGGTGKSVLTASLANRFSKIGRTLILDADMGIGNAHIMQGVSPERSFVELVAGTVGITEVVSRCSENLDLIAAGSGVSSMAELTSFELHRLAEAVEVLETDYQYLLVDSAAGVSHQTVNFAAAADVVIVVTTPAVTAMTDAYAFLKVLLRCRPDAVPLLVVNRARNQDEAHSVVQRMEKVCKRFLGRHPRWIGWVPRDDAVIDAINSRSPVVAYDPTSPAAKALDHISHVALDELARTRARGVGRQLMRRVVLMSKLA
jgi:flagellar biosynthesis protein FlhG